MDDHVANRVALVVDHPERDLPGLVLVALDLARRGVSCHLVPMNLQEREIWAIEPDLVLFNYLRRSNEAFARQLCAAGIAFGVMDTEGAIWSSAEEYASLLWTDDALRAQARCVCMWGASLAEYVVSRGLYSRQQVTVTGCPRFDLYAEPWRRLREDADETLQRTPRRILINTNFSVSNPRFTTAEKCIAMHHAVLGYSRDVLNGVVEAERAAIREIVRMAGCLGERFPSMEIVIRPHPFEDPTPYEAVTHTHENVRVKQRESIQAAIFGARAVIQRSCTTAVEAGLAGVPAFSPQWIDAPFLMPLAEAASVPCASFDDLGAHLDAIVHDTYRTPPATKLAIDDVVRECCATMPADGRSHQRVADAVFHALEGLPSSRIDHSRCRRRLYGLGASAVIPASAINTHDDRDDRDDREARMVCADPVLGAAAILPAGSGFVASAVRAAAQSTTPGTPHESALARAARHARYRLGLSPEWSFTRLRDVPATAWMNDTKHFDAAGVERLVERARALDPLKQAGHVRADPGGRTRYAVVIGATSGAGP